LVSKNQRILKFTLPFVDFHKTVRGFCDFEPWSEGDMFKSRYSKWNITKQGKVLNGMLLPQD
jgi:hypothetical protein